MDVLAIIPARGGSKGIPHKNLAICGGRPLVDWTIEAANESRYVTTAVLSSDDGGILMRARGKVLPELRPDFLAADDTSTEAVLDFVIRDRRESLIVLLQPTSPLRTGSHIDAAIEKLGSADSVVSVVPSHAYLWTDDGPLYQGRKRRQEMNQYEENGAIYVFTRDHWLKTHNRLGGQVELFVMAPEHQLQIDIPADLQLASWLLERQAVLV